MKKRRGKNKRKKGNKLSAVLACVCTVFLALGVLVLGLDEETRKEISGDLEREFGIELDLDAAVLPEVNFPDFDLSDLEQTFGLTEEENVTLGDIPEYDGQPYVEINNNEPELSEDTLTEKEKTEGYEHYSSLDLLGRCGETFACVGPETMPTEERGSIGMIKPSGWHTVRYDDLIDSKYLYNRCHLIGYQLTGENANERNLITGTRYMNVEGMLPFENQVAEYVEETGNHVYYKVVPIFEGSELVARGVHMQARSVEDDGRGVSFNVFVYNVQPGIEIDYETGESQRVSE